MIDILLTLLALLALSLPVLQATQDAPNKPVGAGDARRRSGRSACCSSLFRLIDAPVDGARGPVGRVGRAVAATVVITVAGWLSLAAEYVRGLPPDLEPELRATPAP